MLHQNSPAFWPDDCEEGPREAETCQGERSCKVLCERLGTPLSCIPETIRPLPSLRVAIEWCICKTDPKHTANALKTKLTLEPQPREVGLKLVARISPGLLTSKAKIKQHKNKHKTTTFSLEIIRDPESHIQNVQDAIQNYSAYEKSGTSTCKGKNKMIIRFQLQDDTYVGIMTIL